MSGAITSTAPGKLVLLGEYAVLSGAPAISAAVNVVAQARMAPAKSATSNLRISNCGSNYAFNFEPGQAIAWHDDPGDRGALLQATLRVLAELGELPDRNPPIDLTLGTENFYQQDAAGAQKIGVGSSAALAVALCSAVQSYFGREPRFAVCRDVHRSFQSGKGSGIDVATSWHGGVIGMQSATDAQPVIEQLTWPGEFFIRPVWTGQSASTPRMLDTFAKFRQESAAAESLLSALTACAECAYRNWHAGDAPALVAALDDYGRLTQELGEAAGIDIWSPVHRRLQKLAGQSLVGYKPSGAGGGDFGLAYGEDEESVDEFIRLAEDIAPQFADLQWSEQGLQISSSELSG